MIENQSSEGTKLQVMHRGEQRAEINQVYNIINHTGGFLEQYSYNIIKTTGVGTKSVRCNKTRYFKPKNSLFLTLTKWSLGLNLIRSEAQHCYNIT